MSKEENKSKFRNIDKEKADRQRRIFEVVFEVLPYLGYDFERLAFVLQIEYKTLLSWITCEVLMSELEIEKLSLAIGSDLREIK